MIARFLTRMAARRLGKRSAANTHDRILAVARQIREELGLPADRRLA